MSDLIIRGGVVVDGTGAPAVPGDVVVRGDRVVAVLPRGLAHAGAEVIDAGGRVVAPGFIDMHSHSDLQVLANPDHEARLLQGITTEVLGQDGLSYAPVDDATLSRLREQLKGWNDDPAGFDWNWRSVGEYLDRLDQGTATNVAYLVPHGTLRLLVVGAEDRPPTPEELQRMKDILGGSLGEGAIGLSAGLTYVPGAYATTDELVELCSVVARAGGYFCPHHRNYGRSALEGYAECIEIARRSKVALHFAHAHLSFPINQGRLPELLAMLDGALQDGIDLTFDSYPYLAGMTSLHALLPSWVQAGSVVEQLARLGDPAIRARVRHELDVVGTDGNQGLAVDWDNLYVASLPRPAHLQGCVGRSIADSAAALDLEPSELYLELVVGSHLGASSIQHFGIEEHVRGLMRHPCHTVGTDGILVGTRPHPRSWGTFPRFLGRYVRELGVLDLAEAIRHVSCSAARRLGAPGRGRIAPGCFADLVVFDAEKILDQSTYEDPRRPPVGIDYVIVNGAVAVRNGAITHMRAGRVLRRSAGVREYRSMFVEGGD